MQLLLSGLIMLCGLGSLVCFIMVLIKIFQSGDTVVGIIGIVGICVFGIGGLVVFVYGWIKARDYGIGQIMMAWTGCIIGQFVLYAIMIAVVGVGMFGDAG